MRVYFNHKDELRTHVVSQKKKLRTHVFVEIEQKALFIEKLNVYNFFLYFIWFFVGILTSNDILMEVPKFDCGIENSFEAILFLRSFLEIGNWKFISNQFFVHFILGIRNSNFG